MVGATSAAAGPTLIDTTDDHRPSDNAPPASATLEDTTTEDTPPDDRPPDDSATLAATTPPEDTLEDTPPPTPRAGADAEVVPPPPDDVDEGAQPTDPSQRFVWLIPALIAASAVIVIALFGFGFLDEETEPAAAPEAIATPVPTTAAQTTTTQAPTTTSAPSTTTTSTTIPGLASIESVGNAIPMSSLTLKAGGIGPLVIGDAAPDAIGRLVASLGRPEEVGVAGAELGLCPGEDGRFVRWAGLTIVVTGTLADGVFAGYRFEEQAVPTMHLDLATPSGLRVGDPLSGLNEVYAAYQIDYVSDGGTDLFRLSDVEGLLLWGPVSSIEDSGRVEGIHSPDACSS
jgi:hypothetical protein